MGRKAKSDYEVKRANVPNAGKVWYIIGRPNGKRRRAWFKTKEAAQAEATERNIAIHRFGEQAVTLSGVLAHMSLECAARLQPYGKSIQDATNHYLDVLKKENASITVQKLCDLVLVEYQRRVKIDEISAAHVAKYKEVINKFQARFGDRLIVSVTAPEIYNWIAALDLTGSSKKSYRGYVRGIFRHAKQTGLIIKNPVDDVAFFSESKRPPVPILTVEQADLLLRTADAEIIPYLAIGLFAGPRRSEIQRLDWQDIDFTAGLIDFSSEKTKTKVSRWLKISPNLRAWLESLAKTSGAIWPPSRGRQLLEEAKADIVPWPNNGLRHSFVSYHLAMFEDLAATSLAAGHANPAITLRRYFRRVRKEEAVKYWAIFP